MMRSIRTVGIIALATAACARVEARDGRGDSLAAEAPIFEVDALWPKPLPNHWLFGHVVGLAVDARDRIFVLQRNDVGGAASVFNARTEVGAAATPPGGDCCLPAPNVLELDAAGNLLGSWSRGEGYDWPALAHRIALDNANTLWIGGVGENDAHVVKFARDGKFTAQLGKPSTGDFKRITSVSFDARGAEAYLADAGNRRVVVIDPRTGAIKRFWGAYGTAPAAADPGEYTPGTPAARAFRNVHCAKPSNDGMVYVCDRESNRIQVFRTDGTYVNETVLMPNTRGSGSVWDVAFSADAQQRFMYVADGMNMRVHILDRRTLEHLTSFGTGGRQPGQFFAIHSLAVDSRGNLYTAETLEGKRVQKFVFKGVGPVTKKDQGVLWPKR